MGDPGKEEERRGTKESSSYRRKDGARRDMSVTYTRMRGEDRTKASGTLHIHYSLRVVFFTF